MPSTFVVPMGAEYWYKILKNGGKTERGFLRFWILKYVNEQSVGVRVKVDFANSG